MTDKGLIKMEETPCHLCLVLAICKGRVSHLKEDMNKSKIYLDVLNLTSNCPKLYDYMQPREYYDYSVYHRRLAVHYLTGIELGGGLHDMKSLYSMTNIPGVI